MDIEKIITDMEQYIRKYPKYFIGAVIIILILESKVLRTLLLIAVIAALIYFSWFYLIAPNLPALINNQPII